MELSLARGIILEEVVTKLLVNVGYREILAPNEGTKPGKSGLEVQGRGYTHQIDCLGAFDYTPAFVYPIRLMVEAKCYQAESKIGIEVVRNSVGVLKDISENYFTQRAHGQSPVYMARYNYFSAIFSTSGFTSGAEKYALAHQIYLIQYKYNRLFKPITDELLSIQKSYFKSNKMSRSGFEFRKAIRSYLNRKNKSVFDNIFTDRGIAKIANISDQLQSIKGSYIGMLNGMWPIHLLSTKALSGDHFIGNDVINCKIYGRESNTWSFVPSNTPEDSDNWFRLEFDLPERIAKLVKDAQGSTSKIAHIKQNHFSFLNVSGIIDNVRRQVRLQVDEEWIADLIARNTGSN